MRLRSFCFFLPIPSAGGSPLTSLSYLSLLLFFLTLSVPTSAQNVFTGKVVDVEEGDRIQVRLDGWKMTVRLHGITCATEGPLADVARRYTKHRVNHTPVRVEVRGTGSRQTVYGEVYPTRGGSQESINKELVRVGLARWAQAYAPDRTDIQELEEQAKAAGRGQWGDPSGDSVPLPPIAALAATPTPRATPTPSPAVTATPPSTAATTVTPGPASLERAAVAPAPGTTQSSTSPLLPLGIVLAFLGCGGATFFRLRRDSSGVTALPFALAVAVLAGAGAALLIPLPVSLLTERFHPTFDALLVLVAVPPALFCMRGAIRWQNREQTLRGTAARTIADTLEESRPGWVRIAGTVELPVNHGQSRAGQIPGMYIRETTQRYNLQTDGRYDSRGGRSVAHRWDSLYDDTQVVDFLLTDDTGSIWVDADGASFHPLRVARFYNDVPVETFFDKPYGGDTKTEVFFIPTRADVTVWGRLYRTASPVAGTSEWRIGPDPKTGTFLVVEGNPARIFTQRGLQSLLLMVAATFLLGLVAYCLLSPGDIGSSGTTAVNDAALYLALFLGGGALLYSLYQTYRSVLVRRQAWRSLWLETCALLADRRELLGKLAHTWPNQQKTLLSRRDVLPILDPDASPTWEVIAAEHGLSGAILQLSRTLEARQLPSPEVLLQWEEQERQLAHLRESYNRHTAAWNDLRPTFPTGLFVRVLTPQPLPLWEGA